MLLAWFQHEILGLLCGLLFFLPLIYLRQRPDYFGALHTAASLPPPAISLLPGRLGSPAGRLPV
jgi:hypothetical protein